MQKFYYLLTGSVLSLGLLAGCSSTSEVKDEQPVQEASTEIPATQEMTESETTKSVTLDTTFYFDVDDATLRPNAISIIKAHAERIKSDQKVIRIEGHADERGTDAYNQELGQRRAAAVRDVLVSMGVDSSKIETVSYGEKSPIEAGNTEMAWQRNRRVELK